MSASAARQWRCGSFAFGLDRPLLMGVVNVTPDSFSDGGAFMDPEDAAAHGMKLLEDGADMLDIGGESTRPGAAAVNAEDEKRRILPVIERLAQRGAAVSADTMKPDVMAAALSAGACILNDVGGFRSAEARAVAAASDCGAVIMHMQGAPQTMQEDPRYEDAAAEVGAFLKSHASELVAAGVAADRICVDPGIGFGKTAAHNLQILRSLPGMGGEFPVLAGVSRKSLWKTVCGRNEPQDRDAASAAAAAILARRGAAILRVHNVTATRDAIAAINALLDD